VNENKLIVKSTAAAALLDSMHIVRQALSKPGGISPEQLNQRIYEWQLMMVDLVGDTVKGAELATLYEIIGVMNSSLDLTKTMGLVMDSLIHLTGAERGCLMLLDDEGDLEIQAAQNFDQQTINAFDLKVSRTVVQDVVETKQPVLTTNAQRDPRFSDQESVVGYQLRSIVCVPLHVREQVTGALYLDNRMKDSVFSKEDLPILTAFASQAAVAIENARLYEQAQKLAVMEERQRLARELHDAVTQTLFSASLISEAVPDLWETDPQEGRVLLAELSQLSRGALAEMRTLLLELRPAALIEANLRDLLRQLGEAVAGRAGVPVTVTVDDPGPLPEDVHVAFYRIAQEALNNVVKHARADQVTVSLRCLDGDDADSDQFGMELTISDNGRGFDLAQVPPERLGLGIIRERAQALDADLQIESSPGQGTRITVVWKAES
jgi:signal transduction histidine kinase